MSLSETDKRELCPRCGWVGRKAFQRDRHDLCEAPAETVPFDDDEDETANVDSDSDDEEEELERGGEGERNVINGSNGVHEAIVPARWSRAAARRRGIRPKKTVAIRRLTQVELRAGRIELRVLGADESYPRPKVRGDCAAVPRPCPFVGCSKNLFLDVSPTGSIILNFPHLEPGQMPPGQSCSLDLADRGGMTLEEIAVVMNLTRERIRQIEVKAVSRRAKTAAIEFGLSVDDVASVNARHLVGPGADLAETSLDSESPSDVSTILVADGRRRDE